jgi:hypothetical protein
MSAYNTLRVAVRCSNCANVSPHNIQFRYGDTWQYQYAIGDHIRWGGNDVGSPGARGVRVLGTSEECPICGHSGDEFVIVLRADVIAGVDDEPERPFPMTGGALHRYERSCRRGSGVNPSSRGASAAATMSAGSKLTSGAARMEAYSYWQLGLRRDEPDR